MSTRVELHLNLGRATSALVGGAAKGMTAAVEHLLTEANKTVPHDEGTLERSGRTGVAAAGGEVSGSVSYDTPYAVRQHEDMTLHHDGKGQAKWLENTLAAERDRVGRIVAAAMKGATS